MSTVPKQKWFTFDDFCMLVREDQKADLIDGVIYMASPENLDANDLFVWLLAIMRVYVESKKLGRLFGSRVAFRLDDWNSPEPDIAFVLADRLHLMQRGCFPGHPDMAIEIVSPESVDRDYVKKRGQFERFGVREYWIIDPDQEKITLLRLSRKGKYREVRPKQGRVCSEVLSGFWLCPEWLWQYPRPEVMAVLAELLREDASA
jgi:Uma2 family endonuclease